MNDLEKIFEEIDKNKEQVKQDIQKIFTQIRTELNDREDQLLIEVDQILEKKFFNKNVDKILKEKKFPEKIKFFLEKGKNAEKEWEKNEEKIFLVNDCINIEKTIEKINDMNTSLEKSKSQNKKLNFFSESNELIKLIKKFGAFYSQIKLNQQEININIDNFNPQNLNCIKQISSNFGCYLCHVYDCLCFFVSKNNEYVLGYIDGSYKTIIFYDINSGKEIKRINNAHESNIYTIKHYPYDKYDIILTTSSNDEIKIWNYNESLNILSISKIFGNNVLYSSCIIFDDNDFKIFCTGYINYIKIYNSKSEFIKNIGNNIDYRYYIDSSVIDNKKYLIVGGNKGIQVFNYPELTEYYTFIEGNDGNYHNCAKIVKINDTYNLIDTGNFNSIKIWDFLNKNLITKINSNTGSRLTGFTIINNKYLIIGSDSKNILEFDLEQKIIIKSINKHSSTVVGIKPVKDKNGNIFIVSYSQDKNIFLWSFN